MSRTELVMLSQREGFTKKKTQKNMFELGWKESVKSGLAGGGKGIAGREWHVRSLLA